MSLPVYQQIHIKSSSIDELNLVVNPNLNLKHPVVLNVKTLDLDQQRELVGLIENFYVSANLSYKFPYPVYIISDHEPSITKMPLINDVSLLPKFFGQKESKMNVKETQVMSKNKLLQQEVKNTDSSANSADIEHYAENHKMIFELEREWKIYRSILRDLTKVEKNG